MDDAAATFIDDEKNAQKESETFMSDSPEMCAQLSKHTEDKESCKQKLAEEQVKEGARLLRQWQSNASMS